MFVGLVFIGGGFLLDMLSLFWLAMLISPLLMAVSLSVIGLVFLLTYVGSIRGEVIVTAGSGRLKCRMKPKALDDMVIFLQRFYELRLGVPDTSRFQKKYNLSTAIRFLLVGNALPFSRFTTQPGLHLLIGSAKTDVLE